MYNTYVARPTPFGIGAPRNGCSPEPTVGGVSDARDSAASRRALAHPHAVDARGRVPFCPVAPVVAAVAFQGHVPATVRGRGEVGRLRVPPFLRAHPTLGHRAHGVVLVNCHTVSAGGARDNVGRVVGRAEPQFGLRLSEVAWHLVSVRVGRSPSASLAYSSARSRRNLTPGGGMTHLCHNRR